MWRNPGERGSRGCCVRRSNGAGCDHATYYTADSRWLSVHQPPINTCDKLMVKPFRQLIRRSGDIRKIVEAVVVACEDRTVPDTIMLRTGQMATCFHYQSCSLSFHRCCSHSSLHSVTVQH